MSQHKKDVLCPPARSQCAAQLEDPLSAYRENLFRIVKRKLLTARPLPIYFPEPPGRLRDPLDMREEVNPNETRLVHRQYHLSTIKLRRSFGQARAMHEQANQQAKSAHLARWDEEGSGTDSEASDATPPVQQTLSLPKPVDWVEMARTLSDLDPGLVLSRRVLCDVKTIQMYNGEVLLQAVSRTPMQVKVIWRDDSDQAYNRIRQIKEALDAEVVPPRSDSRRNSIR